MQNIYLIRHAQANSQGRNYDLLTDLGHKQARYLGQYLSKSKIKVDYLAKGDLRRHRETAEGIEQAYREAGAEIEEVVTNPHLNEFDKMTWVILAREIRQHDSAFGDVIERWKELRGQQTLEAGLAFKQITQRVMQSWMENEYPDLEVESFSQFTNRVKNAFADLPSEDEYPTVVLVSSGGPISVINAGILGLPQAQAVEIMQWIYNTSITRFVRRDGRLNMVSMNHTPHLRTDEMRTLV